MINRVIIAGRDAPLWLAASVLSAALKPSGVTVEVVELPARRRPADVYVNQAPLEALHGMMGLDETLLLKATGGAFSLGQMFDGFTGEGGFFHAYGSAGAPIAGQPFLPFWLKARGLGLNVALADFSLTAQAALHGRMLIPDATTQGFARTDYGYHLPAIPYAALLRDRVVRRGITIHTADDVSVEREGDRVTALDLGGSKIAGDLFIDLTGEGRLIGDGPRDSWRHLFPNDRVMTAVAAPFASLPAYARIVAHDNGWVGIHPSRAATHLVHAYAGLDDDAALDRMRRLSGLSLQNASIKANDPGRRHLAWDGNVVALGEDACRLDPVDGVDLHAVQLGLVHLLSLFPADGDFAAERTEYNRIMQASFERVRDFQAVHYLLGRQRPAGPAPASLHAKLDAFAARGSVVLYDEETFAIDSWHALLLGHGVVPVSHDPRIDRVTGDEMKTQFRTQLGFIREQVEAQVSHDDYLAIFA